MNAVATRLAVAFIVLLGITPLRAGAEETRIALKTGDGTVDVLRPDGSLLQSLPWGGDEPDDRNRDFFAFARDMNFDGAPDVAVLFSLGMQNVFYDCWLWREDAGCFVKYEAFADVSNPGFDDERTRVTSFMHMSATDNAAAEYAWEDGRLVLLEETVQEYSPEDGAFVISRHERDADGEMALAEEAILNVADAQERIRKIAAPEQNREGRLTYRHDGLGNAGGRPALLFSFGTDSPEKFTAERHFAVDDAGTVYEMDIVSGPEYLPLKEKPSARQEQSAPLVNNLGFDIEAVYAHSPGNRPWKIAGSLANGETAAVDTSTLQGSRRLIVTSADDENAETPPLQFFSASYLDDAERMELALSGFRKTPMLLTVADGQRNAAIAGLPFDILLSFLESEGGLDAGQYAELMTPLAADGWEEYPCAVVSGGMSWSLLSPGPVFSEGREGKRSLSGLALAAAASRGEFARFLEEFDGYEITLRKRGELWASLESPGAFYAVRFDPETETAEFYFQRRDDADDEPPYPIDAELERRMAADPTTAGMMEAQIHAAEEWTKLLDENYRSLMRTLDRERRERLIASQDAWERYRDAEFRFNGAYWAAFDGTMHRLFPSLYQTEFVKERAQQLERYLEELSRAEPTEDALAVFDAVLSEFRGGDFPDCEYALHDIDGNGTDELLVRPTNGFDEYKLYSHADGTTYELGTFWSRNRLSFDEDGTLFIFGSSGAAYSTLEKAVISPDGTALVILETWKTDVDACTHIARDGTEEAVPEAACGAAFEQFFERDDSVESLRWLPLPAAPGTAVG